MKKVISIILVAATLVSIYALPIDTSAKTVAQFEAEVKKYTQELEATNASLAKNEAEVKAIQNKIANYEKIIVNLLTFVEKRHLICYNEVK